MACNPPVGYATLFASYDLATIWRFPKIAVPPIIIHFNWIVPLKSSSYWVPPFMEPPILMQWIQHRGHLLIRDGLCGHQITAAAWCLWENKLIQFNYYIAATGVISPKTGRWVVSNQIRGASAFREAGVSPPTKRRGRICGTYTQVYKLQNVLNWFGWVNNEVICYDMLKPWLRDLCQNLSRPLNMQILILTSQIFSL